MDCAPVSATTWGVYPDLTCIERSAFTLASRYVDFASFDTDGNGVLEARELHVVIVVAGAEASLHPGHVVQFGENPNGVDWQWLDHPGTGEYFLVENRQKVGLDIGAPGSGVVVWHVNEGAPSGSNEVPNARQIVKIQRASGDLASWSNDAASMCC
eukprot:m51a1_g12729 hypothetical protein (156) ;mRNA; f:1133-3498